MKIAVRAVLFVLSFIAVSVHADSQGWQIQTTAGTSTDGSVNGTTSATQPVPVSTPVTSSATIQSSNDYQKVAYQLPITVTVYPGSLRYNVERIARENHWPTVAWRAPNDYQWVGKTRITSTSLAGVYVQLLAKYPVQAVFYDGNHVLAIYPRNIK